MIAMTINLKDRYDSILAKAKALNLDVSDDAKWYLENWVLGSPTLNLDDAVPAEAPPGGFDLDEGDDVDSLLDEIRKELDSL